MVLSYSIQKQLRQKSGLKLETAAEVEQLALDIESKTGEHLGVNTLKRMLGLADDEREPRQTTLQVIAKYLGYDSWRTLLQLDDTSNSDFGHQPDLLRSCDLEVNDVVEVRYIPDRRLVMDYMGDNRFFVSHSENSKVKEGDIVTITVFIQGYPLIATEVSRQGKSLGSFTAGKTQGITFSKYGIEDVDED